MTQVLSGAGVAAATTMVTRGRPVTAPPAYRAPDTYYEETRARRNIWPWLLGLLACAIAAIGGYLIYRRSKPAQYEQADRGPRMCATCREPCH